MKLLIILTLTTAALCAQYVEILGTDYPAASLPQLNKKMASRVGSGAPTGACTAGLDFYLDSATTTAYVCPAGSWAALSGGGGGGSTSACEIVIGDPGAATPILSDDNDAPALCANVSGATQTITAVACWANTGTPTVRPIITGGATNSLLSSDLTCGTGSYAAGTLNGTPTLSNGATIDANIASAGGVAKYIVIRITRSN